MAVEFGSLLVRFDLTSLINYTPPFQFLLWWTQPKPHHHNRFTAFFPGPPGWAGARRELLDFMVQRKIYRGRHTDHPAGRHSIRTNQCPPPPSPHFFTGRMPFLPPNQQCQSTEGNWCIRIRDGRSHNYWIYSSDADNIFWVLVLRASIYFSGVWCVRWKDVIGLEISALSLLHCFVTVGWVQWDFTSEKFLLLIIIIIIIINDSVYGAVNVTMVTARVHPVHLMNADWAPGGCQPSNQANRLGLWVRR